MEIRYRFWVNRSSILRPALEKSAARFVKLRFREKTLVKTCAVFSEKRALVAGKTGSMLGKTCSVLGENRPRFWESLGQNGSVLVKNRLGLREIGLVFGLACDKAQVSLF